MPVCASDNTTLSRENDFLSTLETLMLMCILDNFKRNFVNFKKVHGPNRHLGGCHSRIDCMSINTSKQCLPVSASRLCENVRFLDQTDKTCFKLRKQTELPKNMTWNHEREISNNILHPPLLVQFHWKRKWICCFGWSGTSKTNTRRAGSSKEKCVNLRFFLWVKNFRNFLSRPIS